jgi:hypothetical protein
MKKVLTNTERTAEQFLMAKAVEESLAARTSFEAAVKMTGTALRQDERGSIIAIRDYAQYRLAEIQGERAAKTQAEIERLSSQLASNHAKLTA